LATTKKNPFWQGHIQLDIMHQILKSGMHSFRNKWRGELRANWLTQVHLEKWILKRVSIYIRIWYSLSDLMAIFQVDLA